MKLGMSTACFFGRLYNEDALREMGRMGIRDAEIFFSAQMEYKPGFIAELQKIRDGEGIRIHAVHALPTQFEPQLFSRHMRQYREALGVYEEALDAGRALGAAIYVFHGPMHLKIAKRPELDFAFAGERVADLAKRAKTRGIALCYENVHWCWYKTPGFARELARHCPSDNLFFTLDMKQAAQSGCDPLDYIDDMGGRLRHIHVCDYIADPEKGVLPCLPFRGQGRWDALRAKLRGVGYGGMLMLEVYARDYGEYRELYDNFEEVSRFFAG